MKNIFPSRIRELRGDCSQVSMARKIGVKQPTYSSWESGTKIPLANMIAQMSITCGISADWLLGLSDNKDGSIQYVTDPKLSKQIDELSEENNQLKTEIATLQGEIQGLHKAIEILSKK